MYCLLLCPPSDIKGGTLQELGFRVLELNAASERSGARLTADVGEALQSDCMPHKVGLCCWLASPFRLALPAHTDALLL